MCGLREIDMQIESKRHVNLEQETCQLRATDVAIERYVKRDAGMLIHRAKLFRLFLCIQWTDRVHLAVITS